jgi:WhiB family redox-sensing transcriptional regulator
MLSVAKEHSGNGAGAPGGNGGTMLNEPDLWGQAPAGGAHWHDLAACRGADPELFFPIGSTGPALHQIDQAKRICQACPVQAPCLTSALDHGLAFGIWGGTTEEERRALRGAPVRQ